MGLNKFPCVLMVLAPVPVVLAPGAIVDGVVGIIGVVGFLTGFVGAVMEGVVDGGAGVPKVGPPLLVPR